MGAARAGRGGALPPLLPDVPRPHRARRVRGHAARGLPGDGPGQLHLGPRDRGLGLDDLQRLAVGPRLVQPRRLLRVRRDRALPRQPGRRLPPAGRDRLPLEAPGHRLPEPAGGARDHPGAARRGPDRGPVAGLQGRGDRRPAPAARLPRVGDARGQGQRSGVPQLAHGADLVGARRTRRPPDGARPAALPPEADDRGLGHLPALPRRHRLGGRRPRCGRARLVRLRPPRLPQRLLLRRGAGILRARGGVPAQPRHR